MDRRDFLKWIGGGVGAIVALSQSQVMDAQQLLRVAGEIQPGQTLWMPDEPALILPPDKKLVIIERQAGVGVYRYTDKRGSFWYDEDWKFVDAFDRNGHPTSLLLNGDGPDLRWAQSVRGKGSDSYRRREVVRWDGLMSQTERTIVAQFGIGNWEYEK